jgi:hypothetical protein
MRPIQILLVALLSLGGALSLSRRQGGALGRIVLLLVLAAGLLMVMLPDQTTRVAAALGVGRGSDLVMYLALVGLAFAHLRMYSNQRRIVDDLTQLTRAYALGHSLGPGGCNTGPNATRREAAMGETRRDDPASTA